MRAIVGGITHCMIGWFEILLKVSRELRCACQHLGGGENPLADQKVGSTSAEAITTLDLVTTAVRNT